MSEKLKHLLEKINQEGVKQAEQNAKAIESKAASEAEKIIKDAKDKREEIIKGANDDAQKTKDTVELALLQAYRDLVLSLKNEVKKILADIVAFEAKKALSSKEIAVILGKLIDKYVDKNAGISDIKILLNKEDLEELKDTFIVKLQKTLKEGIEFKQSPNIDAGFSISFDKGKSFFDFTDEALQEALCGYLNPEISKLFK